MTFGGRVGGDSAALVIACGQPTWVYILVDHRSWFASRFVTLYPEEAVLRIF